MDVMFAIDHGESKDQLRIREEIDHRSIDVRVHKEIQGRMNLKVHLIINSFPWRYDLMRMGSQSTLV